MFNKKLQMITIVSIIVFFLLPATKYGEEQARKVIDITTSPFDFLINTSNWKPGDWSTSPLTVINNGRDDFHYYFEVTYKAGSPLLYETLELTMFDQQNTTLFSGKLKDIHQLSKRFLRSTEEEELTFVVYFPKESGNEFQGLAVEFIITLIAEGRRENVSPPPPKNNSSTSGPTPTNPIEPEIITDRITRVVPVPIEPERTMYVPVEEAIPIDPIQTETPDSISTTDEIIEPTKQGTSETTLPQTGERNPAILYFIGALLILSGLLLYSYPSFNNRYVRKNFNVK